MSLFEKPKAATGNLRKKQSITALFGGENIGITADSQNRKTRARPDLEKERGVQMAARINNFFKLHNIQAGPTVLSAVKLSFLREITLHPQADENELVTKLNLLTRRLGEEEDASARPENPLPTIGVEVEMPDDTFPPAHKTTFPLIGIPCEPENVKLFEVNPKPTHSAKIQNEILSNLDALGLTPHKPDSPLSLHINFGVPSGISMGDLESARDKVLLISNLLVYAFSSANRVLEKEIVKSFLFKTAIPVKKSSEPKRDNGSEIKRFQARLEFRANEFGTYPTYRLLIESQRIIGMFFAHLEQISDHPHILIRQKELAILWKEFEREVRQLLYEERGLKPRLIDDDRKKASSVIKSSPELRQKCRALLTEYSQKINGVIKMGES